MNHQTETLVSDREAAKQAITFKMKELQCDIESLALTVWKDSVAYQSAMRAFGEFKAYINTAMAHHENNTKS